MEPLTSCQYSDVSDLSTPAIHGGIEPKLAINAPKDGRGIGQKQVLGQNLFSTDVHGRTSVEKRRVLNLLNIMYFFDNFFNQY